LHYVHEEVYDNYIGHEIQMFTYHSLTSNMAYRLKHASIVA